MSSIKRNVTIVCVSWATEAGAGVDAAGGNSGSGSMMDGFLGMQVFLLEGLMCQDMYDYLWLLHIFL